MLTKFALNYFNTYQLPLVWLVTFQGNPAWCNANEVHTSTSYGKPCLQFVSRVDKDGFAHEVTPMTYGCEDCLFANIFVPKEILHDNSTTTGGIVIYSCFKNASIL